MAGMINVTVTGATIAEQLTAKGIALAQKTKQALGQAGKAASELILQRGRADISSAGKFGSRWTTGLTAPVTVEEDKIVISVRQQVSYWRVFEYGHITKGRPLLWIPLSFASDAQGKRASEYGALFRVDRKGGKAPLLLSVKDKQPKYFGKSQVRIPKKFHIVQITHDVAGEFDALYRSAIRL